MHITFRGCAFQMIGSVHLDVFQGPLDLLLTLIEKREIDVQAIPVAEVTSQYFEYLQEVEEMNLEWASEFIVLGAELLALKARMLLYRPEENIEETADENPAKALAERLLTYKLYKEAAVRLNELVRKGCLVFGRPLDQEAVKQVMDGVNTLAGVTAIDLARSITEIINREKTAVELGIQTINRPKVTLIGQVRSILRKLNKRRVLEFHNLLSERPTRMETALTVLALLELARRGSVRLVQEDNFGKIIIARTGK